MMHVNDMAVRQTPSGVPALRCSFRDCLAASACVHTLARRSFWIATVRRHGSAVTEKVNPPLESPSQTNCELGAAPPSIRQDEGRAKLNLPRAAFTQIKSSQRRPLSNWCRQRRAFCPATSELFYTPP